jgi:hypothetical protein
VFLILETMSTSKKIVPARILTEEELLAQPNLSSVIMKMSGGQTDLDKIPVLKTIILHQRRAFAEKEQEIAMVR